MISIQKIQAHMSINQIIGNDTIEVSKPIKLDVSNEDPNVLMWGSLKNYDTYKKITHGVLICNKIEPADITKGVTYLLVDKPRKSFMQFLKLYSPDISEKTIASSAKIHPSVTIGKSCFIGENVVIEKNTIIGDHVSIDHNTVIKRNTHIENNVSIGSNNVIGAVGFGYELNDENEYEQLPHVGNVWIKEHVEIGNNNTIDRAVLGSTILREHVKVDNLVHIAHGVDIGKNSLIIANAMIAGSVTIGENVWVAPSSSIINKINIGSDATIGMGCVVIKSAENKAIVVGNPGKTIKYKE